VTTHPDKPAPAPVFKKCVRCGYSLRGLPANHACPECGLRFDERCALYRVTNPRQLMVFWLMIFGGGWVALKHLPHIANLGNASAWDIVGALAGLVWIICVPIAVWFFVRHYRRGFEVAITSDGLIVRLPGFSDALIPWRDIGGASIKDRPAGKPQVASVVLKSKNKTVDIGGVANVFPTRADVEQFVRHVTERLDAADDEGASRFSSGNGSHDCE
jgi:predicted RNA-binding Zn-ribbon protein involved in translation (DUF1610 family)